VFARRVVNAVLVSRPRAIARPRPRPRHRVRPRQGRTPPPGPTMRAARGRGVRAVCSNRRTLPCRAQGREVSAKPPLPPPPSWMNVICSNSLGRVCALCALLASAISICVMQCAVCSRTVFRTCQRLAGGKRGSTNILPHRAGGWRSCAGTGLAGNWPGTHLKHPRIRFSRPPGMVASAPRERRAFARAHAVYYIRCLLPIKIKYSLSAANQYQMYKIPMSRSIAQKGALAAGRISFYLLNWIKCSRKGNNDASHGDVGHSNRRLVVCCGTNKHARVITCVGA
jgi:hypothetical protein